MKELLINYIKLNEKIKKLKAKKEKLKTKLKDKTYVELGKDYYVAQLVTQKRNLVDTKLLKEKHPKIFSQVSYQNVEVTFPEIRKLQRTEVS